MVVSVGIPVRNGGKLLGEVLRAVRGQQLSDGTEIEIVVCDSGSTDGSVELARECGAQVIEISTHEFSHGGTRNLLLARTHGAYVALLTQDALPRDELWLARLLDGFSLAEDVALSFGPYAPRPDASVMVKRELTTFFESISPQGQPRVDRLDPSELDVGARRLLGPRGFFTDANACISREAWREVPFRQVAYAEDHLLAHDMLRAGFAKAFLPEAVVVHSHDYRPWQWLKRSFDESRALQEIYGWDGPRTLREAALGVWGSVGADRRWFLESSRNGRLGATSMLMIRSLQHQLARSAGVYAGVRAGRLPKRLRSALSLERRA